MVVKNVNDSFLSKCMITNPFPLIIFFVNFCLIYAACFSNKDCRHGLICCGGCFANYLPHCEL